MKYPRVNFDFFTESTNVLVVANGKGLKAQSKTSIAQGLKPSTFSTLRGTTEVVPCYKAFS